MWQTWKQRWRRFVARHSSRRKRRFVVLFHYLGLLFMPVGLFALDAATHAESEIWTALYWVSIPVLTIVFVTLWPIQSYLGTSVLMARSDDDEDLDERQRIVRNRAHRKAYLIVALTAVYAYFYIEVVHLWVVNRWPLLEEREYLRPAGIAVVLSVFTLPRVVMAWTEPDPAPEIEEDADRPGALTPGER